MRMHMGSKVTALGLAVLVVGAAAGTAVAASGGSSTAHAATAGTHTASTAFVASSDQTPALAKMTMAQVAAKLGKSEKQMVLALDDMKMTAVNDGKGHASAEAIMVKVLASDLNLSGATAQWVVDEIIGGYVPTYVDWGFGKQ